MSEDSERQGLADPFKGITTNGSVVPGLFQISPSGVSTEPVRNAATKFISTLTTVQLAHTLFPVDDDEWERLSSSRWCVLQDAAQHLFAPVVAAAAGS